MKICLFGASSSITGESYIKKVEELGELLAKRGHELIFGAGANGLMGAAARGFKAGGGRLTGIVPSFFTSEVPAVLFQDCDEIIYTKTMAERKSLMEDKADAFITVPGGIGTMEEFFEVLTLKQLGRHAKAIVIYNVNGYFDKLIDMLHTSVEEGFLNKYCLRFLEITDDPEEAALYLEHYDPSAFDPDVAGYRF
ncbi:MAG: TIGR00730 family Rossman fold protein [Lachnospiraceae bacterium]|nr:TIGR00730 family Rossman fold protein [Lachnospiraceae bacterium]